jgi:hypothetical protein
VTTGTWPGVRNASGQEPRHPAPGQLGREKFSRAQAENRVDQRDVNHDVIVPHRDTGLPRPPAASTAVSSALDPLYWMTPTL